MQNYPSPGSQQPGQPTIYASTTPAGGAPRRSRRGLWIGLIVLVLLLAIGVTGVSYYIVTGPTRAVNGVVTSYYTAVEKQDYATAYTCLDTQQYIAAGGLTISLSQNAYVLAARANDLANGTLTAFSIGTITIDGSTAHMTVTVTRGGTARQVNVQLAQVNGTWEIDNIS
jgi:hypothetical protein